MAGQLTGSISAGPGSETRSEPQGFTLIELLVVITLLSLLSVGSALLVARPGNRSGADADHSDMTSLRQAHDQMRSLAIHGQILRGIYLDTTGRRMAVWRDGVWQPSGPHLRWHDRVRFRGLSQRANTPQIVFYPSGETSPFRAHFSSGGAEGLTLRCHSDGWTGLQCDPL